MTIDAEKYMKERVDDQIDWHDRKSSTNQKCFKRLQMISLASASLIPFLTGVMTSEGLMRIVVGALGVLIAIVGAAISLYQFQQLWIDYRLTAEALRGEKYRFETKAPPYDGPNAFRLFVEAVEATLSEQNAKWQSNQQAGLEKSEQQTKTGG